MTLSPHHKRLLIVAVTALVCVLALVTIGYQLAKDDRQKKSTETVQVERAHSLYTQEYGVSRDDLKSVVSQMNTALLSMQERVKQAETRQSDVQQNVQREIIRIPSAPVPSSDGQPIVINVPQGASAAPSAPGAPIVLPASVPQGVPVEIVREIIQSQDKSRTETSTEKQVESASSDVTEERRMVDSRKSTESEKVVEDVRKEEVVVKKTEEEKPAAVGGEEQRKLGVGVLHTGSPFVAYDFQQINLGAGRWSAGRLGLGAFITKDLFGDQGIDGGPQVNLQPGKGNLGFYLTYGIKSKTPFAGVAIKF